MTETELKKPDDAPDAWIDIIELFEDLGPDPCPLGRPDDFPGIEEQTVLYTSPPYVAGKQYEPDPTGERRAKKIRDFRLGTEFVADFVVIDSLEGLLDLLHELSTNNTAFLVRGTVSEWAGIRRRRKSTREVVTLIPRRMADRHEDGALEDECRQLQMLDLDGVRLPGGMSVIDHPRACIEWAVDNLLPPEFRDASFVYQLSNSAGLTKASGGTRRAGARSSTPRFSVRSSRISQMIPSFSMASLTLLPDVAWAWFAASAIPFGCTCLPTRSWLKKVV
jgi:hypothetical protein